jgi:hypothetical protein
MRHNAAARRMRNRNGGGNQGQQGNHQRRGFQNKNRVLDSNGPDVRIRGTAYQIVEKYVTLAKDAASAGDRVLSESYLQHAEHYQRLINSWAEESWNDPVASDVDAGNPYERFAVPPPAGSAPQSDADISGNNTEEDLGLPASILTPTRVTVTETVS